MSSLTECFRICGGTFCEYISSSIDLYNLIASGLLGDEWEIILPLKTRYKLYTNPTDCKSRILNLFEKHHTDYKTSNTNQTLNIWKINLTKITADEMKTDKLKYINDIYHQRVYEKYKSTLNKKFKTETDTKYNKQQITNTINEETKRFKASKLSHCLSKLCDKNFLNHPECVILIFGYIAFDLLRSNHFYSTHRKNYVLNKDEFDKECKFTFDVKQDIVKYWMRLFFEYKFSENITNFKLGNILSFECEFDDVFNADKYDSVSVLNFAECWNDVPVKFDASSIKNMILLPDLIPIKKWFNIKVTSTTWSCSCEMSYETHTYNLCIGQIDLSTVNSSDELELVVWKMKSNIEQDTCCCS